MQYKLVTRPSCFKVRSGSQQGFSKGGSLKCLSAQSAWACVHKHVRHGESGEIASKIHFEAGTEHMAIRLLHPFCGCNLKFKLCPSNTVVCRTAGGYSAW